MEERRTRETDEVEEGAGVGETDGTEDVGEDEHPCSYVGWVA